jgi:hypothetical protein
MGTYKVCYEETDEDFSVRYSSQAAHIRAPWRVIREGESLLYAAIPFIEVQRQQYGYTTIHSAAVYLDGRAILLMGKEGSGKTTTALGLCRTHGAQLIGNDLVIIGSSKKGDRLKIHGGTKFITLRYESIRRNMPDLLNLFPDKADDPWLRKVSLFPQRANISLHIGDALLTKAYIVHVDETKDEVFVKAADNLITRLYLNENFSRYIRGTCVAILGQGLKHLGYVPSFDSEELFSHRVVVMEQLLSEYSMMYISGPLMKVVEYIATH